MKFFSSFFRPTEEEPAMLERQQEEDLAKFTTEMRRKLIINIHKGGWENESPFYLLRRLHEEVNEIMEPFEKNDFDGIIDECADVANFAMMLSENVRRLRDRDSL